MVAVLKQQDAPETFADLIADYADPLADRRQELVRLFVLCQKNRWNDILCEAFVAYGKQCLRSTDRVGEQSVKPTGGIGSAPAPLPDLPAVTDPAPIPSPAPGPRPAPEGRSVTIVNAPHVWNGYRLSDFIPIAEQFLPGRKDTKYADADADVLHERVAEQEGRRQSYNAGIDSGILRMQALAALLEAEGIKTLREVL